ncbi:MAG: hypothetical protein ABL957_06745 [Parvularculaceae bacterium]
MAKQAPLGGRDWVHDMQVVDYPGRAGVEGRWFEQSFAAGMCLKGGKQVVVRGDQKYCGSPLDAAGRTACTQSGGKVVRIKKKDWCETSPTVEDIPGPSAPKS